VIGNSLDDNGVDGAYQAARLFGRVSVQVVLLSQQMEAEGLNSFHDFRPTRV
jgi:hypothetical protein